MVDLLVLVLNLPFFAFAVGKTNGDLHKTLMSVMGLIFFLGANGGLCLALVQGKVRFPLLCFDIHMLCLLATHVHFISYERRPQNTSMQNHLSSRISLKRCVGSSDSSQAG